MDNKINFWGIEIGQESETRVFKKVDEMLGEGSVGGFIATLNPEILLKAEKDKEYGKILNKADLKIVDGFGIKLVSFLKGKKVGDRVAGVDLAEYILNQAEKLDLKIGLIIRKNGLSTKEDLRLKIEDLGIKEFVMEEVEIPESNSWNFQELDSGIGSVDILLVGLGAPFQEEFIWQIRNQLPNLKLAMGVGGTFDFWTGKRKRAPEFMRKIGMEWLWRLFMQPKRLGRIWKATVVFGWRGLK
jgi:N-acetylglucosaminyldiphosphoundecaprenol N-acetyl-beta-D-mannosaminyltransferase